MTTDVKAQDDLKRILLVEDRPEWISHIKRTLEEKIGGYQVIYKSDADEAIKFLDGLKDDEESAMNEYVAAFGSGPNNGGEKNLIGTFDAVITDLHMGGTQMVDNEPVYKNGEWVLKYCMENELTQYHNPEKITPTIFELGSISLKARNILEDGLPFTKTLNKKDFKRNPELVAENLRDVIENPRQNKAIPEYIDVILEAKKAMEDIADLSIKADAVTGMIFNRLLDEQEPLVHQLDADIEQHLDDYDFKNPANPTENITHHELLSSVSMQEEKNMPLYQIVHSLKNSFKAMIDHIKDLESKHINVEVSLKETYLQIHSYLNHIDISKADLSKQIQTDIEKIVHADVIQFYLRNKVPVEIDIPRDFKILEFHQYILPLHNIILNAAQYASRQGGSIKITVDQGENELQVINIPGHFDPAYLNKTGTPNFNAIREKYISFGGGSGIHLADSILKGIGIQDGLRYQNLNDNLIAKMRYK
ncbi:MAG: PRKCSH domain-containing protein [archaeon]